MRQIIITADDETIMAVMETVIRFTVHKVEMVNLDVAATEAKAPRHHHKRKDGQRAIDILAAFLNERVDKTVTHKAVRSVLTKAGFAEGTVAPMMSRMNTRGIVEVLGERHNRSYRVLKQVE